MGQLLVELVHVSHKSVRLVWRRALLAMEFLWPVAR